MAVVTIIGLLLTILKLYSDYAVRRAEAAYPPMGQFVTTEGVAMHYLERGTGRPIVLIHGSDGVLQDFILSGMVDRLSAEYRVIAFDRPGHGYSGRPEDEPLTVGLNARLMHGALEALGVEKPLVAGHSYGGAVALQYAVDYPNDVAGLLLLAPDAFSRTADLNPMYTLPDIPVLGPLLMNTLMVPVGKLMVPTFNRNAFYPETTPPEYLDMMKNLGVRPKQYAAYTDEWQAHHESMTVLSPRYGEIRVPVTVIAGAEDRLTRLEDHGKRLERAIPGAKLIVPPNTGHEVHYQHPEVVVEAAMLLLHTLFNFGGTLVSFLAAPSLLDAAVLAAAYLLATVLVVWLAGRDLGANADTSARTAA